VLVGVVVGCGSSPDTSTESAAAAEAREAQLVQRERDGQAREAALAEQDAATAHDPAAVTAPSAGNTPAHTAPRSTTKPTTKPAASAATDGYTSGSTAPAYAPAPTSVAVAAGTPVELEMLSDLSSGTSLVGDPFRARVVADVYSGDTVAIPAGAEIVGSVTEVVPLKKIGGQPAIALGFERLELPSGQSVEIQATLREVGKKQTGRDAAKIGGGAAAGAVVGHQIDGKKGKLIGAIVGGAIGAAAAANTGKEIELVAGTPVAIELENTIEIPRPR
jgi:hypothetical protein